MPIIKIIVVILITTLTLGTPLGATPALIPRPVAAMQLDVTPTAYDATQLRATNDTTIDDVLMHRRRIGKPKQSAYTEDSAMRRPSQAALQVLNVIIAQMASGWPQFKIPPLDPFVKRKWVIRMQNEYLSTHTTFSPLIIHGLANIEVKDLTVCSVLNRIDFEINFPNITTKGKLDTTTHIDLENELDIGTRIKSKSHFVVSFENLNLYGHFKYRIAPGETVRIYNLLMMVNLDNVHCNVWGVVNGVKLARYFNKYLRRKLLKVINENSMFFNLLFENAMDSLINKELKGGKLCHLLAWALEKEFPSSHPNSSEASSGPGQHMESTTQAAAGMTTLKTPKANAASGAKGGKAKAKATAAPSASSSGKSKVAATKKPKTANPTTAPAETCEDYGDSGEAKQGSTSPNKSKSKAMTTKKPKTQSPTTQKPKTPPHQKSKASTTASPESCEEYEDSAEHESTPPPKNTATTAKKAKTKAPTTPKPTPAATKKPATTTPEICGDYEESEVSSVGGKSKFTSKTKAPPSKKVEIANTPKPPSKASKTKATAAPATPEACDDYEDYEESGKSKVTAKNKSKTPTTSTNKVASPPSKATKTKATAAPATPEACDEYEDYEEPGKSKVTAKNKGKTPSTPTKKVASPPSKASKTKATAAPATPEACEEYEDYEEPGKSKVTAKNKGKTPSTPTKKVASPPSKASKTKATAAPATPETCDEYEDYEEPGKSKIAAKNKGKTPSTPTKKVGSPPSKASKTKATAAPATPEACDEYEESAEECEEELAGIEAPEHADSNKPLKTKPPEGTPAKHKALTTASPRHSPSPPHKVSATTEPAEDCI